MELLTKLRAGARRISQGDEAEARAGNYSELIVSEYEPRFFELVREGRVFSVPGTVGGFAGAASHVSPLTAATGTPVVGIYKPVGSNKAAVILSAQFIIAAVADTAVGLPVWNIIPANAGITANGNVTPVPNLVAQAGASVMRCYTNTALTGSAVGVLLRHFAPDSIQVAVASATAFTMMTEKTDGRIIVPPGAFAGLALSAAGTTYNVSGDIEYAEMDWPLA